MEETKAQRIYNSTLADIRWFLRNDVEHKDFYISFTTKEDETMSVRTVNEIERINEREITMYKKAVQRGWVERNTIKEQAFKNMRLTIKKWRQNDAEFKELLKSI